MSGFFKLNFGLFRYFGVMVFMLVLNIVVEKKVEKLYFVFVVDLINFWVGFCSVIFMLKDF